MEVNPIELKFSMVIATGSLTTAPLFRQLLHGKAASGLERILCGVLLFIPLKTLQESIDGHTSHSNMTEIMLQMC